MRSKEFMDKDVFALDEKIGKVKEIGIDPEDWKITHLEIELEKSIAESVLGAKKVEYVTCWPFQPWRKGLHAGQTKDCT